MYFGVLLFFTSSFVINLYRLKQADRDCNPEVTARHYYIRLVKFGSGEGGIAVVYRSFRITCL
jgi:hypothetical protein